MSKDNLIRRAKITGFIGKLVQKCKAVVFDTQATEDCERWQDYGFAGNPVDAEGLIIDAGGMQIIIRADRIKDRPDLKEYEVAVWTKGGHFMKLDADGKFTFKGSAIDFDVDSVKHRGVNIGSDHAHGGVRNGSDDTGAPH